MRPAILTTALCALLVALLGVPAQAATPPDAFALPDGFRPEGIAIGAGHYAYVGSLANGDIYRADLRTGAGAVFSKGPGTPSNGLKADGRHRLFVSGGSGGNARVVDLRTGAVTRSYTLASGPSFVNDVVLAGHAAWFTDSANPVLYKLPLGRHGQLPAAAVTVPLTGAIQYAAGTNANGIAPTPDGRKLIVVQSNTGKLFTVNRSGVTAEVDLGGETLANGDGLLLDGRTLYVVQNRLNTIAVIRVSRDGSSGRVVNRLTDARFDVPTTLASFRHRLYLPNARFTTTPAPDTTYSVVAVKPGR